MNLQQAREYIKEKHGKGLKEITLRVWISRGRLEATKNKKGQWETTTEAIDKAVISKPARKLRNLLDAFPDDAMKALSEKERFILEKMSGIGGQVWTQEELGEHFKHSRQRVHQIKDAALLKLFANCILTNTKTVV